MGHTQISKIFSLASASKFMQAQKGFTLIELLVVIAIIGILAGMVVVNMSSAPDAAKNSKLQSYFDQLRNTAIVFSNSQPSATFVGFTSTTDGLVLYNKIVEISGAANFNVSTSASNFCAKAKYTGTGSTSSTYWCIDSDNGYSGTSTAAACTSTSSNWDCL